MDAINFTPGTGNVAAIAEGYVLWTHWSLIEETKLNRAPTYLVRYFLQPLNDGTDPRLAYEHYDVGTRPAPATILNDRAILLYGDPRRYTVGWITVGQKPRHDALQIDNQFSDALILYPDGIIVRPVGDVRQELVPIWWVPIRGQLLDFDGKVSLTGDANSLRAQHLQFIRYRDQIAWLDAQWSKGKDQAKRHPPVLHVFDIQERSVRSVELHGYPIHHLSSLATFDGKLALTGGWGLADVETGRVTEVRPIKWDDDGRVSFGVIGMRDGVIYAVRTAEEGYELRAIPVDQPNEGKVIHRWDAAGIPRTSSRRLPNASIHDLFFFDGDTVRAWNGRTWIRVGNEKPRQL